MAGPLCGLAALEWYNATPGDDGSAPLNTVLQSPEASPDCARLVAFLHPHCPCSRNSLSELGKIASRFPAGLVLDIYLVKPAGMGTHWEETGLASQAREIPAARVHIDENGSLAKKMRVGTSGHVVLFDKSGHVSFSGGITRGRGHEGESTGSRALADALRGVAHSANTNAVFGCPLFYEETKCLGPTAATQAPFTADNSKTQ
jgi:hypothetical protein